jgi:hypothetical protein
MNVRPYTPEQIEEIDNLAAGWELDPARMKAAAAELLALRRVHEAALFRRHRLATELARLPGVVGDVTHYKARIRASRQAAVGNDGYLPDLVSLARP